MATSSGDVWLATQKPVALGLYSTLWKLMTADIEQQIKRNVNLKAISAKKCRSILKGIMATKLLEHTAKAT